MNKKMNCTMEVCEKKLSSGLKVKSLIITTPKGTSFKVGNFSHNRKLVYKLCCEVEGK